MRNRRIALPVVLGAGMLAAAAVGGLVGTAQPAHVLAMGVVRRAGPVGGGDGGLGGGGGNGQGGLGVNLLNIDALGTGQAVGGATGGAK